MTKRIVAIAVLLVTWAAPAIAQNAAPLKPEPRRCFRGQPLPRCKTFVLFEMGSFVRLEGSEQTLKYTFSNDTYQVRDLNSYLAWEIGAMVNTDSTHARGATFHIGGAVTYLVIVLAGEGT